MKLLAICIPTFNRAQSIRQQLSNLLGSLIIQMK